MRRLKPQMPRMRMTLGGRLDQARLERLREVLGLTRMGRLTDREDEHFGFRDVSANRDRSVSLDLWRVEDIKWSLSISAEDDVDFSDEEIAHWQAVFTAAAREAELEMLGFKVFPPPHRESYQTRWENENWLRTMYWDLPAQNLKELWWVIGVGPSAPEAEKRDKLVAFMASPTWKPAPPELRRQAEEFVRRAT
ncbi:hypothetical protein [Nocardia yamanashiensis]|uniref:hypothetical protein n=1 Tax=Nocardia yamanashiensis TaxID=209247 RepID=UPI000AC3C052|nr:hypothetical protein [Nocardia yamanashiensis]